MYTDYHCHILPHMDDGSESLEESLELLQMEKNMGVDKIYLTPHFYGYKENVDSFLKRRDESYNELMDAIPNDFNVELKKGAEVYLCENISRYENISDLCYDNTDYLLVEMPFDNYSQWVGKEIENLLYNHQITPVLAHLNRYLKFYSKKEIQSILSIGDMIVQINNSFVNDKKATKYIKKYIEGNYPIVYGSDCHNTRTRKPNFDKMIHNELGVKNFF